MISSSHQPVMLEETIAALDLKNREVVVDATFGRGGHTQAILEELPGDAKLIVVDRDIDAITHAKDLLSSDHRVEIVHASFSSLREIMQKRNLLGNVDAILFDLGVSSPQLDNPGRGFSFSKDGPLDMRMDQSKGISAAEWLKQVDEMELIKVLKHYGEERFGKRIATRIKQVLAEREIVSTADLSELISGAMPFKEKNKHPATRSFQAIRIAVNDELREIEKVLPMAIEALARDGRIVIISFHSLEDRIVKQFLRGLSKGDPYPPDLPVPSSMIKPTLKLVGKAVKASDQELKINPRARSAVLRVAEKVAVG